MNDRIAKLILATGNQGKLAELQQLLADKPIDVLGLNDYPPLPEPEETGQTFAENATTESTILQWRT